MASVARALTGLGALLLALGPALVAPAPSSAEEGAGASTARASRPPEAVVADLQAYIPERLASADVPGLAVALVHEGEVVWQAGFGVANTLTDEPVTEDSVFAVASLSKPVAAYIALDLVDSGRLDLDEPVHGRFEDPWLPPSERADRITLRHLLAHTSGLSNRLHPLDKSVGFPPGERFSYSSVGYQYLQAVIEQAAGSSLERVARETVFEPLAMRSTSFAESPGVMGRLVSGHITYGADLGPLVVALGVCVALVSLVGMAVLRLTRGRTALTWRHLTAFYAAGAAAALVLAAWLNGGLNKWSLLAALLVVALSAWLAIWLAGGRLLIRRAPALWSSRRRRTALGLGYFLCCVLTFAALAGAVSGPVPERPSPAPGAAYSLKSTAGDLARFMIELAEPAHLDAGTAAEMVRPQVRTSGSNSWGLGVGVYHAADGDWLWHAGDDLDFHALMVMRPGTGDGVVVLVNGQAGQSVVYDVARRAMGVEFTWSRSADR
ncbi:MAG: serine hydrolase domain-containing protein [Thermoleophilia bacterium]|nr:serine hydrolase domain-containing protein [Thermoleophilia bacterium]